MSLLKLFGLASKPMRRVLKGRKVIEYSKLKDGTRLTKLYDRYGACYLEKTSKIVKNNNKSTRYKSEIARCTIDSSGKPMEPCGVYFHHIKSDRIYNAQGDLSKVNRLTEAGYAGPASGEAAFCRTFADVKLTSQKTNGITNTITGRPNIFFEYTNKLDSSPTIW